MNLWRWMLTSAMLAVSLGAQQPRVVVDLFDPGAGSFPTQGEVTTIGLSAGVPTGVTIIYRPASLRADQVVLESTPDGSWAWTPRAAGLAEIRVAYVQAGEERAVTRTVSVAFASTIDSGVVVMLLAGLVLFGGAFVSIRTLLRDAP